MFKQQFKLEDANLKLDMHFQKSVITYKVMYDQRNLIINDLSFIELNPEPKLKFRISLYFR